MGYYENVNGDLELRAGSTLYADAPVGTIQAYGGTSAPSGWMICNGASLLRTDYAELFAVIGTAFGSADSTHFNIPDLRGEFLRGAGTNSHSGQGNGSSVGQHQDATGIDSFITEQTTHRLVVGYGAQNRNSTINADSSTRSGLTGCAYQKVEQSITDVYVDRCFVRPTNTSVNYIIKAKMVALPADLEAAIEEGEKYSTTEVKTNKTWIDGKPIYRRVFTGLSYGTTSGDYRDVGVTIPSIEMLVNSTTIRSRDGAIDHLEDISIIAKSNGVLQCLSRGAYSPGANILIIEYTKTTD